MTASKTTAAKKPQDHKPTAEEAHDARLDAEALLADMPSLKEPHRLRVRDRNKVAAIIFNADSFKAMGDAEPDPLEALELCALIDEFAESIAADPEAYSQWAEGKGYDVFFALFAIYAEAVGESLSSAS